jgi:TusA-related sulfurtransferase/uncharacterized OsmC-like protein
MSEKREPDAVIDGGDLDCGSGLLLMIRNAFEPVRPGGIIEIQSREGSVREDLPAWCRMVGHRLLDSREGNGGYTHYFVEKKGEETDEDLTADLEKARNYTWKVRVKWVEGMQGRVFSRNHAWDVGQPLSFNTEDKLVTALEHLLGAIGSCLALGLQWRLTRRKLKVTNLEVTLHAHLDNVMVFLGIEDDDGAGLKSLDGKAYVQVEGDISDDDLQQVWAETIKRSPVVQSLGKLAQTLELRRVE